MHNILQLLQINKKVYIRWRTEIKIKTTNNGAVTTIRLWHKARLRVVRPHRFRLCVHVCVCMLLWTQKTRKITEETSSSIILLLLTCPLDADDAGLVIKWSWNWPHCLYFWLYARRQRTHYSRKREKKNTK